ncbi:contact-dependent growth inhibition system immunity protein [Nocardioides sp. YIM 152315]|uniref:contact-dependent growth inhibition system immunity protein n=1 Tax=Nocardioides sp. YIM 152315 TaxID=3031760 RepID=UPI0023D9A1FD|nr:contact-dependent growth inhibition system immunity protein [Nocardioides sp. YIM 152315]MDF1604059.1 contact-dependent growth inhibition system immunity protein [Nocardioides sp. YIM 152315]
MNKTPALWNLVGIYFNQDWPEDYGSEEASINAFLEDFARERVELQNELKWILDHFHDEDELAAYLDAQGSEYLPPKELGGYRGWLIRILEQVRSAPA